MKLAIVESCDPPKVYLPRNWLMVGYTTNIHNGTPNVEYINLYEKSKEHNF